MIVLAFPFYWALTTTFKKDRDLYNSQSNPYLYNDGSGHAHWNFWHYMTFHHVSFLFKHTEYGTWLVNTAIVGVSVVAITLVLALPAGYALARLSGQLGPERRRGHLPRLPRPADAPVPAALAARSPSSVCATACGR